LYKLKRHVAAWRTRLWWDYPPCRLALNKHTYFTVLQIVESAFHTSFLLSFLKMGIVFPLFQYVGTSLDCHDFSDKMDSVRATTRVSCLLLFPIAFS